MKRIILIVATLIVSTICITGCGTTEPVKQTQKINITYNKKSINTSAYKVIATGEKDNNFVENFTFDADDIYTTEDSYRDYYFDGAYYIQIGLNMYRFQLNEQGLIESYIKYNLEG